MIERGFIPEFSKDVLIELASITAPAKAKTIPAFRDMRELLWVSIDNDDSRDLDQLTYAEDNRIYVAVADVDAIVKKGLPIDNQAAHNTTSIYTPTVVFPMLPLKLSNDLTSLNENTDRCANVVEMEIADDGRFHLRGIYPALVRNRAKLTYHNVAGWRREGDLFGPSYSERSGSNQAIGSARQDRPENPGISECTRSARIRDRRIAGGRRGRHSRWSARKNTEPGA